MWKRERQRKSLLWLISSSEKLSCWILEKVQKKGNATTENSLNNFIPLISHIYFTGITTPTTPQIAPKYLIIVSCCTSMILSLIRTDVVGTVKSIALASRQKPRNHFNHIIITDNFQGTSKMKTFITM